MLARKTQSGHRAAERTVDSAPFHQAWRTTGTWRHCQAPMGGMARLLQDGIPPAGRQRKRTPLCDPAKPALHLAPVNPCAAMLQIQAHLAAMAPVVAAPTTVVTLAAQLRAALGTRLYPLFRRAVPKFAVGTRRRMARPRVAAAVCRDKHGGVAVAMTVSYQHHMAQ